MKRRLLTGSIAIQRRPAPAQQCLTPRRLAARALGVRLRTLEDEALALLSTRAVEEGAAAWEPASPGSRRAACREALRQPRPGNEPPGEADELARLWAPLIETVLRAGIEPERLLEDEKAAIRRLGEVTRSYRQRLAVRGLIDPAALLWEAARLVKARRPIFVHGYFQPRPDELAMIDALAGDGSGMVLPDGPEACFSGNREAVAFLVGRGWEVDAGTPSGVTGAPRVSAHSFATVEAEARGALREVRRRLAEGVPAAEIVLVTADPGSYGPALQAVGWEYGLPIRVGVEMPLAEHRYGSWVRQMLEMVESGGQFEPTLRLLGHALSPPLDGEHLREARRRRPDGSAAWLALGVDLPASHLPASQGPRAGRWPEMIEWLQAELLKVRQPLTPQDQEVEEAVQRGLAGLAPRWQTEEVTIAEFRSEVEEMLNRLTLPPSGSLAGGPGSSIELHRPEAVRGARFRYLFWLGMVEGETPRPVSDQPILDLFERKRLRAKGLGLESAVEMAHRESLTVALALASAADQLWLSVPRMKDGRVTAPAAWLKQVGGAPLPHDEADDEPISIEEARRAALGEGTWLDGDPAFADVARAWRVEMARESSQPPDEYDGVTGEGVGLERKWSVSQLTRLGQCPFSWFSRHVLGITEEDEMPDDMTPRLLGILLHRTLEVALGAIPPGADPRAHALDRLDEAWREAEATLDPPLPRYHAWEARRREWLTLLRRAINSPDFIRPGARVSGCERAYEGNWFGLRIGGFIDRIDETADGIEMVDYKTSSSYPRGVRLGTPREGEGLKPAGGVDLDLQIPIYVQAGGESLFPGRRVTGRYFSLRAAGNLTRRAVTEEGQLAEFAAGVRRRLERGEFPVEPDRPDLEEQACQNCEYGLVCRRGPRLARKQRAREREASNENRQ